MATSGLAVAVSPLAIASPPLLVEVFTAGAAPVEAAASLPGARVIVHRIDTGALARLATDLGDGLPADPAAAETAARQRLRDHRPRIEQEVQAAIAGLARAAELGLDRYPAVVVDGRTVVYGETDVARAVARADREAGR
jgi:integrating conjugative element protein (TIGR03757 family)